MRAFLPEAETSAVFDQLSDLERYGELVDVIRSVDVVEPDTGSGCALSAWEVYFHDGILVWTEEDRFRRDELRIDFAQVDGDFDEFRGAWHIEPLPGGAAVTFTARFDFGVPSLDSIIEPMAERLLVETIERILSCLFESVVPLPAEAGR
ncbi:SRPBCC family protein [Lentzea roselyniae]|uniref:SRPBCC family protein n=1 Tax=Lentzea roselyniae TaxID=531940 RepID=A0ABP7CBQ6_9PSEU